jgi:hypothetical protein
LDSGIVGVDSGTAGVDSGTDGVDSGTEGVPFAPPCACWLRSVSAPSRPQRG